MSGKSVLCREANVQACLGGQALERSFPGGLSEGLLPLALYQAIKYTCNVETINCQLIEILSLGVFFFILAFKSKKNSLKQFAW